MMRGEHIQEHFRITIGLREAQTLRDLLKDVASGEDIGRLNEAEEDALSGLLLALEPDE